MRLFELFDKVADWSWASREPDHVTAEVPTLDTDVMFELEYKEEYHTHYDFPADITIGVEVWRVEFSRHNSYEQTGKGNEFEVFAVVMEIIKQFNILYTPAHLYFTSKSGSRQKLYERMLAKFAAVYGFTVTRMIPLRSGEETGYMLSRKKNETI